MKKFYDSSVFRHPLLFLIKCLLAGFIATVTSAPVTGQTFSSIAWVTAREQPVGTHEVHGEVVKGKIYIFGGYDVNKKPAWTPTKRSYVYDPIADTWSSIADLPHTPSGAGFGGITHVGLTNDGTNIYFAGGYTSNSDGTGQLFGTKQVWRYNVGSNTYSRLPDLPQALAAGQLRYLNGKIHYMGGANLSRQDVGVHYALDLNNLSAGWKSLAPLINPVNHPGSAVYGGKIYFVGGAHYQDDNAVPQKTLEVYDEKTNTWTKLADMPVARDHISSAVVVMGTRILVLGGETTHNVSSKLVSAYSPSSNTWTELSQLPTGKSGGVAAVLNGNIYYTGGNFSKTNHKGVQMTTLLPIADAFVRNGGYASANYGRDTILDVKSANSSGYTRYSLLKFSISAVSSVSSAKLRIYGRNVDNTTTISLAAYSVANDSWTETGITFNNLPVASTSALASVGVTSQSKYYELDVTNYVKSQLSGDKIVSLLIKNPTNQNSNLVFKSRENANNKPELVILSAASRSTLNEFELNKSSEDISATTRNLKTTIVYPNPSKGHFNLKFPNDYEGDFFLDIVDQTGRVYNIGKTTVQIGGASKTVDISNLSLAPGVYYLRIKSKTKNEEVKLVVQ